MPCMGSAPTMDNLLADAEIIDIERLDVDNVGYLYIFKVPRNIGLDL